MTGKKVFGVIAISLLAGLFTLSDARQEARSVYLQIDYLKVAPDDITDFLQMMEELWKPVHEERLQRGVITNWSMYEVLIHEPGASYNFVIIHTFDDFRNIYSSYSDDVITTVFPGEELNELKRNLRAGSETVNSELWQVEGEVTGEDVNIHTGAYITKNYMDSRGGTGEHTAMELDFWGPIHRVRLDTDILNSWAMYTLVKPGGDARNYTYSTIDYYGKLGDIEGSVGMDLARIAHPDKSDSELQDYFSRTGASRDVIKTELWRSILTVNPLAQ